MIWILIFVSSGAYNRGSVTEFSKTFDSQASCEQFAKKIESDEVTYKCIGYSR